MQGHITSIGPEGYARKCNVVDLVGNMVLLTLLSCPELRSSYSSNSKRTFDTTLTLSMSRAEECL